MEKEKDMNFVVQARNAYEAGYMYDNEYIMLLGAFKASDVSFKQEKWMETIANRIEAGITVQARQSLAKRPLRHVTAIDAVGNRVELTSFDVEADMAAKNLVPVKSKVGRKRARSAGTLK